MIKYKVVCLLLLLCYLVGINDLIELNETKCVRKTKRSLRENWLTKLNGYINTVATYVVNKLPRSKCLCMNKNRHKNRKRTYPVRGAIVFSAMAMQTKIGTHTNTIRFDTD